ncbi:MAG TPA: Hsp70 family protein, partial [Rhizomicrobium sp.]|nr:Hsp70 family protein [Rhizomicrobium sp.]
LSDSEATTLEVNYDGKPVTWRLDRNRFESICEPLMARVRAPLERALRDARISPETINRVIFAGGAARMPMFRRLISRLLRQLPTQHINPDEVVARGAAVRAGLQAKSAGLEERVLTDVAPFTLGVEVAERGANNVLLHGLFLPVIERNTIIPASRSHVLSTLQDGQSQVNVRIFQGESRMVSDNVFLGQIEVSVTPGPAGKEQIDIRFSYDTSGLLEVDATVLSQKMKRRLLIRGNAGVLSEQELQQRLAVLAKLKVHPRDQAENVAVIERAKRLYEENLGDTRLRIGQAIEAMMAVLERQDPQEIAATRAEVSKFLDAIDRSILS